MKRSAVLGLGMLALVTGAATVPAYASVRSVSVGSFYFEDSTPGDGKVVIDEGDQITFTFTGNTVHTATVDGMFDSGKKSSPQTYTTGALTRPGTYTLYCSVHGASRHSTTLIIRSTSAPPPSPSPAPPPPSPSPSPAASPAGGSTTGGSTTGGSTTGGSTTGGSTTGGSTTGGSTTGSTTTGSSTTTSSTTGGTATTASKTSTVKASPSASARSTGTAAKNGTPSASPAPLLAPTGDGVAAPGSAAGPVVPGSLTDVLGRQPAKAGSWTRSILWGGLLLIPMLAAAAWALRRRRTELP